MIEPQVWTIQKLIQWTAGHFASKQIPSSRLDAEILLANVLKCRRLDLYLKFDQPLQEHELKHFKSLMLRRAQREPIAYITGTQEFFGRSFSVGPGVLIPRPETEHLIEEALSWIKQHSPDQSLKILDIGSGSGCIAVTLAVEIPKAQVMAIDNSEKGFQFTSANVTAHGVADQVRVVHENFNSFVTHEKFDIIATNPPYIGLREKMNLQVDVERYEPPEALFGGEEGHETLSAWLPKIKEFLKPGGLLLCELGADQGVFAQKLAAQFPQFTDVKIIKDCAGHDRILKLFKSDEGTRG